VHETTSTTEDHMPRTDDHSPGDARQPYSDEGGPGAHHAQTHDVEREEATRPKAQEEQDDFAADLGTEPSAGGHVDESTLASDDKALRAGLPDLDADDLKRLSVLATGTRLDQGSTYVDLNALGRGPFKAMGDQSAGEGNRYVAKRDTDHEMWDRLVGQGRTPRSSAPGQHG
jgi:hypothetical protein